jgi:hypothetical protein
MKDEDEIPWSQVLGFLFLLFLGVGVPFLMEYKSRSAPLAKRISERREPQLIDRRAHYCPACGGALTLPSWRTDLQEDVAREPLFLDTTVAPTWGMLDPFPQRISTSTHRVRFTEPLKLMKREL